MFILELWLTQVYCPFLNRVLMQLYFIADNYAQSKIKPLEVTSISVNWLPNKTLPYEQFLGACQLWFYFLALINYVHVHSQWIDIFTKCNIFWVLFCFMSMHTYTWFNSSNDIVPSFYFFHNSVEFFKNTIHIS